MRNFTLLFVSAFVIFQSDLVAQRNSPQLILSDLPSVYGVTQVNQKFKELKIQTIEYSQINAKGVQRYSVETYDTAGLLLSKEIYNHKGLLVSSFQQSFNENKKRTSWILKYKGKETKELMFFDEQQRLSKFERYKNGKLLNSRVYLYEGNMQDFSTLEEYNSKGLQSRIVNSIDQSGRKTKTEHFNKRNKLISVYDYECPSDTLVVVPKKDHLQICHYDASQDGFLIRTTERVSNKGSIARDVYTYRAEDTVLLELAVFQDNSLKIKILFHDKRDLFKEYVVYDRNGKEFIRHEYNYDERWNMIEQREFIKGALQLTTTWFYNDDNVQVKSSYQNAQRRTILTTSARITAYHH